MSQRNSLKGPSKEGLAGKAAGVHTTPSSVRAAQKNGDPQVSLKSARPEGSAIQNWLFRRDGWRFTGEIQGSESDLGNFQKLRRQAGSLAFPRSSKEHPAPAGTQECCVPIP